MSENPRWPPALYLALAALALLGITSALRALQIGSPTIAALTYLLVILLTATVSALWSAVVVSLLAVFSLNYFFMPPVGTLIVADPQNWVALITFLAISIVASNLSTTARDRAREAVAMATERAQFLEERKTAELARQSEELKSALLASLSHDLRTPLTAIRVAASNLQASWLEPSQRSEQGELILVEIKRLERLFQNILEMARIDAGAITTTSQWVHPSEIFEAAQDQVEHSLRQHVVEFETAANSLVRLDPRLTASALAHVLENAAQYTAPASPISVKIMVSVEGVTIHVRDRGPGITPEEMPHLFERFFRGGQSKHRVSGTGMGLAIARGMLAAEHGRIWADNCPDGGAMFTMFIPAESKTADDPNHP